MAVSFELNEVGPNLENKIFIDVNAGDQQVNLNSILEYRVGMLLRLGKIFEYIEYNLIFLLMPKEHGDLSATAGAYRSANPYRANGRSRYRIAVDGWQDGAE